MQVPNTYSERRSAFLIRRYMASDTYWGSVMVIHRIISSRRRMEPTATPACMEEPQAIVPVPDKATGPVRVRFGEAAWPHRYSPPIKEKGRLRPVLYFSSL